MTTDAYDPSEMRRMIVKALGAGLATGVLTSKEYDEAWAWVDTTLLREMARSGDVDQPA